MQVVPLKHWNDTGALLPVNMFTSKLQQSSIHMCRQMCIWCFEDMPVWESWYLKSFVVNEWPNSLLEWRGTTVQQSLHLRLGLGPGRWSKPGRETWPSRTRPEIPYISLLTFLVQLFVRSTHLSYSFDTSDETDVYHTPGSGKTHHQPPLQWSANLDVRGDVQSSAVPEVIHRRALFTLLIVACQGIGLVYNSSYESFMFWLKTTDAALYW